MFGFSFKLIPQRFVGIDIGTDSIKVAELYRFGHRIKLENYGEISAAALYKKPFRSFEKNTLLLSSQDIGRAILAVLQEAGIKTKKAAFSIPDFSSFFTWFSLPSMSKEELPQAVKYEARQHIPVPLSEVTLDWQVVEESKQKGSPCNILLVAVPNEIINQYQDIAKFCQLELQALEAEVFGLLRALLKEEKRPVAMIDLGAQTTTCSIAEKGILKRSHTIDFSGNDFTSALAKSLGVSYEEGEKVKREKGLKGTEEVLLPILDFVFSEIDRIFRDFGYEHQKTIEKIILAGGSALMPGLKEEFEKKFKAELEIAHPFSDIFYPPILDREIKKLGPAYAIAVGMALRGLQ